MQVDKTKVSAINQNKEVVFESVGGPGSPAVLRFQAYNNILEPLRVVFNEVKDKYDVTFIQIGVSGFGVLENISEIENKLYAEFGVEVKQIVMLILAYIQLLKINMMKVF